MVVWLEGVEVRGQGPAGIGLQKSVGWMLATFHPAHPKLDVGDSYGLTHRSPNAGRWLNEARQRLVEANGLIDAILCSGLP